MHSFFASYLEMPPTQSFAGSQPWASLHTVSGKGTAPTSESKMVLQTPWTEVSLLCLVI